jgi:hypothetical protein
MPGSSSSQGLRIRLLAAIRYYSVGFLDRTSFIVAISCIVNVCSFPQLKSYIFKKEEKNHAVKKYKKSGDLTSYHKNTKAVKVHKTFSPQNSFPSPYCKDQTGS